MNKKIFTQNLGLIKEYIEAEDELEELLDLRNAIKFSDMPIDVCITLQCFTGLLRHKDDSMNWNKNLLDDVSVLDFLIDKATKRSDEILEKLENL